MSSSLALAGILSTRRQRDAEDYFLAGHRVPVWLVAVSVLSTTQSAATFLGAPDFAYRGDYTYLASYLGPLIAAFLIARFLIPRFYAEGVTTVYELLAQPLRRGGDARGGRHVSDRPDLRERRPALSRRDRRLDDRLRRHPAGERARGLGGAGRLGLAFTFIGGLRSVIWSDLVQVVLYVGAALGRALSSCGEHPGLDGRDRRGALAPRTSCGCRPLARSRPRPSRCSRPSPASPCSSSPAWGSTRTSPSASSPAGTRGRAGARSTPRCWPRSRSCSSSCDRLAALGRLRPARSDGRAPAPPRRREFEGEKITIFMHYILTQIPPGVRGFVAVGVLAAAAVNSGLISMSSVLVQDFYRPWVARRGPTCPRRITSAPAAIGMVLLALALLAMSVLCFYWQRYTEAPLLDFALGGDELRLFRPARRLFHHCCSPAAARPPR